MHHGSKGEPPGTECNANTIVAKRVVLGVPDSSLGLSYTIHNIAASDSGPHSGSMIDYRWATVFACAVGLGCGDDTMPSGVDSTSSSGSTEGTGLPASSGGSDASTTTGQSDESTAGTSSGASTSPGSGTTEADTEATGGTTDGTTTTTGDAGSGSSSTGPADVGPCGDEPFAGGLGTEDDPFEICSVRQLHNIQTQLDAHFELTSDLDFSDGGIEDGVDPIAGWEPIGTHANPFTGSLQGNGHVLSNLVIHREGETYVGLFGDVSGPVLIENLGVVDASVWGDGRVGVLVGALRDQATARRTFSTGEVHAAGWSGGLIGECGSCVIDRSWSTASVEDVGWGSGGLVGFFAGGTVGQGLPQILDCYARGAVQGDLRVGGLVGWRVVGILQNTYAAGSVSGAELVGGLVGETNNESQTDSSYWDTELSGQPLSGGGEGRTSAELQQAANYVGWDFALTWCIDPGINDGYPTLRDANGDCP